MPLGDVPMRLFRTALMLTAVACAAAVTPTAAQQVAQPGPAPAATTQASDAQAGAPSAPLPGPRLRPELPRVPEPNFAERGVTPTPVAPAQNHTIVVSTLALVLIVVLVTILVVK